jgi:hypothetical protein
VNSAIGRNGESGNEEVRIDIAGARQGKLPQEVKKKNFILKNLPGDCNT